ncbi:MAG: rod shape-determining protein MreC [Patescibacteria group bacterium]|nr:rod shape-determining protein MreC [Patescibacteria group bacterium]MBU1870688.1 rod shape-determining protein MreC [Patescibacteria group bacterium]
MLKFSVKKHIIVGAVVALLIFFHFIGILSPFESTISYWLSPLFRNFYSFSSGLRLTYNEHINKSDLTSRIKQLENQLNKSIIDNVKLKILEEENQALRQNLKFLIKSQYHYAMANIISRGEPIDLVKGNKIIIIDKGSDDGLFPGLPVVSSDFYGSENQGLIIGKIVTVKNNLSEVCLLNNQNCKLAGSLLGQTKINGIVSGELGLTVKMEFIPQTQKINKGDIVVTSGLEQNIPQGLVIGKVIDIVKNNNELWQSSILEPLINFDDLIIVAVLLP